MLTYRLYGPKTGNSSWPRVAAGVEHGLVLAGEQVSWYDTSALLDDGDALTDGWNADVGLYVGPPNECSVVSARGRHRHRLAMIAANSSWLPESTMRFTKQFVTGYMAPSRFAQSVLEQHSGGLPVFLFQHGVSDAFVADDSYLQRMGRNGFLVAHFASTPMQRKGTNELIQAWAHVKTLTPMKLDQEAMLDLYIEGSHGHAEQAIRLAMERYSGFDRNSIRIFDPVSLDESAMCRLYQTYHLVAQPSRAEGFGLVPLEALCSGVPVLATLATGHLEYLRVQMPGAVTVKTSRDEPIDDGPGAMAPGLDFYVVAAALSEARRNWSSLAGQAVRLAAPRREQWSWQYVTEEFVSRLGQWIATHAS